MNAPAARKRSELAILELRALYEQYGYREFRMSRFEEYDFYAEYLDAIISCKVVKNYSEAIDHINKYGTHHSDVIISDDVEAERRFPAPAALLQRNGIPRCRRCTLLP